MMAAMVDLFCDSFDQVPRRILLIGGEELSYTATQKVDLKAVRVLAIRRLVCDGVDAE